MSPLPLLNSLIIPADSCLQRHHEKVMQFATCIGVKLGLPDDKMETLRIAAQHHDIGKKAIPEEILFKAGRLSSAQWSIMKLHPVRGVELFSRMYRETPPKGFNEIIKAIYHHHEAWDGSGYLAGLKGSSIPLAARIIAVADAYDAMTTDRPYRKALDKETAIREIVRCTGTQFDPEVVAAFLEDL